MTLLHAIRDERGSAAIEFGMTAPLYFLLLFGLISGAMLLWVQVGLQHGTEMAARCATVDKNTCGSESAIKAYAASQTFGLTPPPSVFTVTDAACGNRVTASYAFPHLAGDFGIPVFTITAQSCFPK